MKHLKIILSILLILNMAVMGYAKAPAEIGTSGAISNQLVDKEGAASPNVITGESLVGLIKQLVDFEDKNTNIVFHRKTGKLFVKNTPKNQKIISDILAKLRNYDARQIMIEARIVEVSSFEGFDIGIDWTNISKPDGSGRNTYSGSLDFASGSWGDTTLAAANQLNVAYGYLNGSTTLDVTLRALEQNGKINTLSNPQLMCFNNQRANIKIETTEDYVSKVTTDTVYSGDNVDVHTNTEVDTATEGIVLDVTPSINSDNKYISLELHPTVIELVSLSEISLAGGDTIKVPKYVKRSADTTVNVEDGGTVVIGGLMKRTDRTDVRKVPILGDMPFIKNLFRAETKYEDKSNLLIFITAEIKDK